MTLFRQILRFLVSGGSATAVHWCVMSVLIHTGVGAGMATAAGAFCGAVANYLLQYHFTFRSDLGHGDTLPGFALVSLASLALNSLLFHLIHDRAGIAVAPSQVLTTGLVAITNFLCFKRLVFHERPTPSPPR